MQYRGSIVSDNRIGWDFEDACGAAELGKLPNNRYPVSAVLVSSLLRTAASSSETSEERLVGIAFQVQ